MEDINKILEDNRYRENHFHVPEGYFQDLPDRVMERIRTEGSRGSRNGVIRIYKPWMSWISGAAAVLLIGWFGIRGLLFQPDSSNHLQEQLSLLVEYYGADLNEALLAGLIEESDLDLSDQVDSDIEQLVLHNPDQVEALIYKTITE